MEYLKEILAGFIETCADAVLLLIIVGLTLGAIWLVLRSFP